MEINFSLYCLFLSTNKLIVVNCIMDGKNGSHKEHGGKETSNNQHAL